MAPHHQVLVVGAGPSGSALSMTLASAGISVLVVEQTRYEGLRVGELLSPRGQTVLDRILPDARNDLFLTRLEVTGTWSFPVLSSLVPDPEYRWWAIDRVGLDRRLAEEAARAGADLRQGSRVKDLARTDQGWSFLVETDGRQEAHTAGLLVDATGRGCQIARSFGARRQRFDRQVAVVGFLEGSKSLEVPPEMLLEAVPNGWWYAAPLEPGAAVAVFVTDNDLDKGQPDAAWHKALAETQHTRKRFSRFDLCEKPRRVSADSSLLLPAFGDGWVAVGDAAASFDPLSSLGIGQALEEGLRLADFLIEAYTHGQEPNFLYYAEETGVQFSDYLKGQAGQYRQVHRWPDSPYWSRRLQGAPGQERSLRFKHVKREPRKLIFPPDQRFECSACGKCCRSAWTVEVEPANQARIRSSFVALRVLQETGQQPLQVAADGRVGVAKKDGETCVFLDQHSLCSLHAEGGPELKPSACRQFPFLLRETPDGVVVGVSHLCNSIQRNEGRPLEDYAEQIQTLLNERPPVSLSKTVSVTWGRGISWSDYTRIENLILEAPAIDEAIRELRWGLAVWLSAPAAPPPTDWKAYISSIGPMPEQTLRRLEGLLAVSMIARLEGADVEESSQLVTDLLNDQRVKLRHSGWEGQMSDLPVRDRILESEWVLLEGVRYLKSLLRRKFLLIQTPLMHNLCLLAALPQLLGHYTVLNSVLRGGRSLERQDFYKALDLTELHFVTHGREDNLTQTLVRFHLDEAVALLRSRAQDPSGSPHKSPK
ncbi:MAG: FAD-dependent monooxygenase [Vulcanimicrobiota bacterium]